MGGGASQPAPRPGDKRGVAYAAELKPEGERIAAKTPPNPLKNAKAARESKRLEKLAMGQAERDYDKGVAFNRSRNFAKDWDESDRALKPTVPIPKGNSEGNKGAEDDVL